MIRKKQMGMGIHESHSEILFFLLNFCFARAFDDSTAGALSTFDLQIGLVFEAKLSVSAKHFSSNSNSKIFKETVKNANILSFEKKSPFILTFICKYTLDKCFPNFFLSGRP